jgi:type III pantothenate kinase
MSGGPYLLIDAGNSRIKWALAQDDGAFTATGAFGHRDDAPSAAPARAAISAWRDLPRPRGAWLSNVAGAAVAQRLDTLLDAQWPGLACTTIRACARQCGVTNGYTAPAALGSDRWAGLIGAHAAFPGEALLLATFGTATTLEALRADGLFAGGLIAPGWTMMMRALGEQTAQLPTLDARTARAALTAHSTFLGTDTPGSLSAGCLLAQAGLIERTWRDLQDAWGEPVRLVVSGGAVDEVTAALKVPHTRHDSLVLSGLARIAADSAAMRLA